MQDGTLIKVYWNLRKHLFSIAINGKIVEHLDSLYLRNAKFVVSKSGRDRVRKQNRKNVHAYIIGIFSSKPRGDESTLVKYDPFLVRDPDSPSFYKALDLSDVYSAESVTLSSYQGTYKGKSQPMGRIQITCPL